MERSGPASVQARTEQGRGVRNTVARRSLGEWAPREGRTDPLEILALQATTRSPDLVPIRYGRMAASPFAFFRGAAAVMAADLATMPGSGLMVQLCGDAHLVNFGGFGSPERDLVFDVNDFDETLPGPFEWDVRRLAASLEVAGRGRGLDGPMRTSLVTVACRSYRQALADFAAGGNFGPWYAKLDTDAVRARWGKEVGKREVGEFLQTRVKAESRDHLAAVRKLVEGDGELRFRSNPPLLVPAREINDEEHQRLRQILHPALEIYRKTLAPDRRVLFDRYQLVDLARKVVGVGSVGTRCWVMLLVGRDADDPLLLQIKQAEASVLAPFLRRSRFANQGQRVVEGQRIMQATGDILLGWSRFAGLDGVERDFYIRQLWDWKVSANVDQMRPAALLVYAQMCGWVLARAHARSGDAVALSAYLGTADAFDRAMVGFALAYADQNERDHDSLVKAIASGRVEAVTGI